MISIFQKVFKFEESFFKVGWLVLAGCLALVIQIFIIFLTIFKPLIITIYSKVGWLILAGCLALVIQMFIIFLTILITYHHNILKGWLAGPSRMSCLGQHWPSWHLLPHHTAPGRSHQVSLVLINIIVIEMQVIPKLPLVCCWWHFLCSSTMAK